MIVKQHPSGMTEHQKTLYQHIEVRGDPHEEFPPQEGGLTRIMCFSVVVIPPNVKFSENKHPGLDADDQRS